MRQGLSFLGFRFVEFITGLSIELAGEIGIEGTEGGEVDEEGDGGGEGRSDRDVHVDARRVDLWHIEGTRSLWQVLFSFLTFLLD